MSWRIADGDGAILAGSPSGIVTLDLREQVWWPRQCRRWEDAWDQRYSKRHPALQEGFGDRAPPGQYRVRARWAGLAQAGSGGFTLEA